MVVDALEAGESNPEKGIERPRRSHKKSRSLQAKKILLKPHEDVEQLARDYIPHCKVAVWGDPRLIEELRL